MTVKYQYFLWNWTMSLHTGIEPRMVLIPEQIQNGTRNNLLFNRRCPGHIRRSWINSLLAIGRAPAKRSQLLTFQHNILHNILHNMPTQHVACILPPCCDMQIELMRMFGRIVARTKSRSQSPCSFWSAPRHGALEQSISRVQDFRSSSFTARARALVTWRPEIKSMWMCSTKAFNTHWKN